MTRSNRRPSSRRRSTALHASPSDRLQDAGGRPQHPRPRRPLRAGAAAPRSQALRRRRLRPRQPPRPHGRSRAVPRPRSASSRTGKSYLDVAPGAGRARHRRGARPARLGLRLLKIGMVWPLDPGIIARIRRGARPHHRGRGEALAARDPAARAAVQRSSTPRSSSARRTSRATISSRPSARSSPTRSRWRSASA